MFFTKRNKFSSFKIYFRSDCWKRGREIICMQNMEASWGGMLARFQLPTKLVIWTFQAIAGTFLSTFWGSFEFLHCTGAGDLILTSGTDKTDHIVGFAQLVLWQPRHILELKELSWDVNIRLYLLWAWEEFSTNIIGGRSDLPTTGGSVCIGWAVDVHWIPLIGALTDPLLAPVSTYNCLTSRILLL